MANNMTNTTNNTVPGTGLNKTFFDRELLEGARTRLVHADYGQKRSIPAHNGKRVEFRRWNLFDIDENMCALSEGVTPDGQTLSQSIVEAEVSQYGAYVEISDLLEQTAYEDVLTDSAALLGEQLGTVVEWVTRDAMCSGNNVQRAGGKTLRSEIEATDTLTVDEIRKAVRTLKKAKARPFGGKNGRKQHFICICSPDATYDLQNDPMWQDVSKYAAHEQLYTGEIGMLFGVVFVESTEAKVIRQAVHTKVAAHVGGSAEVTLEALSKEGAAFLNKGGAMITLGDKEYAVASADAEQKTVTLQEAPGSAIGAGTLAYTAEAGKMDDATKAAADVHMTLVFGKDAYGTVDLSSTGAVTTIIKGRGSAGTDDPLDQRATVGAKVMGFTAAILNDLWLLRIEHGVSA